MTDMEEMKIKEFLADVPVSDPLHSWPACASCAQSVWMIDRETPRAFCQTFGGLTYGEEARFIWKCEAHQPIA
ncbi:hypothetical protein [Sphingomonas aracearum]|uniref:hypothetical protein n=1 Tax=Sphingomonas aracearum TaxID=2283317 RepID=UPI0011C04A5D|nr:hypothetical protein [Sphingomonas aracearum]